MLLEVCVCVRAHVWECVQNVEGSGVGIVCMCVDRHLVIMLRK